MKELIDQIGKSWEEIEKLSSDIKKTEHWLLNNHVDVESEMFQEVTEKHKIDLANLNGQRLLLIDKTEELKNLSFHKNIELRELLGL